MSDVDSTASSSDAPRYPNNDPRYALIVDRVKRESSFFGLWTRAAQRRYRRWNYGAIGLGALVPIIPLFDQVWHIGLAAAQVTALVGIVGALATFCKSIDGLQRNKDTWLRSSAMLTKLHGEIFLFDTKAGAYATASDGLALLAQNVEALIERESDAFADSTRQAVTTSP